MYEHEGFQRVGSVDQGAIIMKLPGTDIKMPYASGSAFVSAAGDVGYVTLNITDLVAESVGKPEGMFGLLGEQLAAQLQDPAVRSQIPELVSSSPLSLFYSRTQDGLEVLTIPGMSGKTTVEDQTLPGLVVGMYNSTGALPSVEDVYAIHAQVVANRKLSSDKTGLASVLWSLPQKANFVYDGALASMKKLGW